MSKQLNNNNTPSPDLIIQNAKIITCDINHQIFDNAALALSGNSIVWIKQSGDALKQAIENCPNVIDAGGKILMPGLINMHAHCGDSLFRGLVENLPLEEWLQTVWKAQAIILPHKENCRLGAELGIAELLLGGTTTVMDNYWSPEQTIAAAKQAGIRIATGGIFFDDNGMDGESAQLRPEQAQALFEDFAKSNRDETVFVGTMPHGTYTVGPENLKIAIEIANSNDGFFSIHAAETTIEQQTAHERYKTSVIRLLHKVGGLSNRTVLAHCVHVDDDEIGLIAKGNSHVVHNPLSNLKLASGFAPVTKMISAGINVGLGTDGPISGNDLDMWLAMRLAATIHKAANNDPSALSTQQVLHMATLNGARALNAENWLGSIEPGKRADFILLDISGPHAIPMFDPINHVVFSASKNDVCDVFVAGRHIVQSRNLTTLNIADISARVSNLQPQIAAALE